MKTYIQFVLTALLIFIFTACSSKQLKEVGSSASNSGAMGLIVGGTLYGIGVLIEDEETPTQEQENIIGENENGKM